jgi:hypothetical protein
MQKFKDIILKNLCSAVIFFTYLLVMPSVWMAEGTDVPPQIFIGNGPGTIEIQQGKSVEVPVFFVGGMYTGKEVELYVFRIEDGEYVCFGPGGWESDYVVDREDLVLEDFKPVSDDQCLPEYILLRWQAFEDSQSLSNFDLYVCVDDQVDGIPTENSVYCGCQSIIIEQDNNGTGTGDDNVTGTAGDDPGSGGIQPLTAPPFSFLDLVGDSGGACNSLEYTPEGTTFSRSSISKSLELGESEEITLLTSACGNSVTVSSVYKASGGEWLSVSSGGGSKVILNLDANATGLQAGSTYTGAVTVVAGGITDNMWVTLRVLGECNATSASVTPTSLTFQAYVGGQNPSAQTIRVKDNCGHAVSATVSSKPNWLTLTQTGTGVFSVSCVDIDLEEEDSYSGRITLSIDQYERFVSVTLEVTHTPTTTPDDSVTTVESGHMDHYDVGRGQTRYFKFVASVFDNQPIIVISTPGSSQPRTVHILVKRGGKPSIADFNDTWDLSYSMAGSGVYEDLYWYYSTGSAGEMVKISTPTEENTYYVMMYNAGETKVYDQQFTVSYYD